MAEYTFDATVIERFSAGNPVEKTYEGASDIKVSDGHLVLATHQRIVAVYAPGNWISVYRTQK